MENMNATVNIDPGGNYIEKIRINAATFHKNFSAGEFDKNGPLVNEKIYINSNGTIVVGRDLFIKRIRRYSIPFPKLRIIDKVRIVDGNQVALLYVFQGTHNGPYGDISPSGNKINIYSAEFFTMDEEAKMKELLTITRNHQFVPQVRGEDKIDAFEQVALLSVKEVDDKQKALQKRTLESYVQNFNMRYWNELDLLLNEGIKVDWNGKKGSGRQLLKDELKAYCKLLPDATFHIERNVVEGNRGSVAYTINGTYPDSLKSYQRGALTQRVNTKEACHISFDTSGKIMEITVVSNADAIKKPID